MNCLDCSPGCDCRPSGAPESEAADCQHGKCAACRRCACCCLHAPGVSINFTLPLCYLGRDLASLGELTNPKADPKARDAGLQNFFRGRRDAVAYALRSFGEIGLRGRPCSDWKGKRVLVIRDTQGGAGDKILFGQLLHALAAAGADLWGLLASPNVTAVSLEVERRFWPEVHPLRIDNWLGYSAIKKAADFDRVVGMLSVPVEVVKKLESFAAAALAATGTPPVQVAPALDDIEMTHGLPSRYFVAHVGAKTQRYADEAVLQLAAAQSAALELPLVVVGHEKDTSAIPEGAIDMRPFPFEVGAAVVARAAAGCGPDSAMAHVAGLTGVRFAVVVDPSVAWLAETGIDARWWTGHYPSLAIVPIDAAQAAGASE